MINLTDMFNEMMKSPEKQFICKGKGTDGIIKTLLRYNQSKLQVEKVFYDTEHRRILNDWQPVVLDSSFLVQDWEELKEQRQLQDDVIVVIDSMKLNGERLYREKDIQETFNKLFTWILHTDYAVEPEDHRETICTYIDEVNKTWEKKIQKAFGRVITK